jgi:hypothetical protein
MFWNDYEPPASVAESQKRVAAALRVLAAGAASDHERERLDYLAGYVGFLVPYTEAWTVAHRLQLLLNAAAELRKGGEEESARAKVAGEGIPLWLRLAPEVRRAMLTFQRIVSTRNDLGTLASLHNKFVRLALVRLRLSMKEYLGELPLETETAYVAATRPDDEAVPRLIVPTRPTFLAEGESLRVTAVVAGPVEPVEVVLHLRPQGAPEWSSAPARLAGRRTWRATLGPIPPGGALAVYFVEATLEDGAVLVFPPDAPSRSCLVTLASPGCGVGLGGS